MTTSESMTGVVILILTGGLHEAPGYGKSENEYDRYDQGVVTANACFQGVFEKYDRFKKRGRKGPFLRELRGVPVTGGHTFGLNIPLRHNPVRFSQYLPTMPRVCRPYFELRRKLIWLASRK